MSLPILLTENHELVLEWACEYGGLGPDEAADYVIETAQLVEWGYIGPLIDVGTINVVMAHFATMHGRDAYKRTRRARRLAKP
jgi:hypothetical protein